MPTNIEFTVQSSESEEDSLDARILNLQSVIDSGSSSVSVDGVSASIDIKAARKRLRELLAQKYGKRGPSWLQGVSVNRVH